MSTLAIIILILFCAGIIVAIVGHLGYGIYRDAEHRMRLGRRDRRVRRDRSGGTEQTF